MRGVPREVEETLTALDQPWELKQGNKHIKIMVCGQLAGVLPRNGKCENDRRATRNIVSQIKRVARTGHAARRATLNLVAQIKRVASTGLAARRG